MSMQLPLGELISVVYEKFLVLYADEEIAALATAQLINELLEDETVEEET